MYSETGAKHKGIYVKRINHKTDERRARLKQVEEDNERGLAPVADLDGIEAVVGIPFYDEDDTLPGVVETACRGLALAGLSGKSIVLCVGPEGSTAALDAALKKAEVDHGVLVHGFLHTRGLEGRGCCNHSILEAASRFGVPLVLLPCYRSITATPARERGG